MNDFLSQNGIVVEQILQSAATGSVKIKTPIFRCGRNYNDSVSRNFIMNSETKICQNCKNQLTIEPEDFEFTIKLKFRRRLLSGVQTNTADEF